ncbi:MAG TPA: ABC transporter substrate-binding protein, partial [Thiobacillus sp.]
MHLGHRIARVSIAGACIIWSTFAVAIANTEIVIGQVAPMTGALAQYGKEMTLGVDLYVRHVNDKGGINGQKIRVAIRDDGYKIDETIKQTRDVIANERAIALIGFAGTGNVGELLKQKVLADANIALIAPYTGGEVLRTPFNPYVFHIRAG